MLGEPVDEHFNIHCDSVAWKGISMLLKESACEITKEIFDRQIAAIIKQYDCENKREMLARFLYKEYTFHFWR